VQVILFCGSRAEMHEDLHRKRIAGLKQMKREKLFSRGIEASLLRIAHAAILYFIV
jgi:hypothetical protein